MRCSKCGRYLGLLTRFCSKCGAVVSAKQRKIALITFCVWLAIFLGLIPLFYFPFLNTPSMAEYTKLNTFFAAIFVALVFSSALFLIYSILSGVVHFIKRQPILGSVVLAVVLLLVGFGVYLYRVDSQKTDYLESLTLIQDNIAEATAAKIMGDSLIENKPIMGASWERVKIEGELVSGRLKEITPPVELADYHRVALDWADSIYVGSQSGDEWKKMPTDPGAFKLEISDKQAIELFTISTKKIAELKEFGDEAIRMNNQTGMLYIGARLRTQRHFLNGVLYSNKASLFSLLISRANAVTAAPTSAVNIPEVGGGCAVDVEYYQQTGITRCKTGGTQTQTPTQPTTQTKTQTPTKPVLQPITGGGTSGGGGITGQTTVDGVGIRNQIQNPEQYQIGGASNQAANKSGIPSGWEYVVPRKICIGRGGISAPIADGPATNVYCIEDAVQSMNEIETSAIGFAQGKTDAKNGWENGWHNAQEAGLTVGEPTTSGHGPVVQAFYDACAAKGGVVGGTGSVKSRLPTTESGYTCNYKNGQVTGCWDYLTYSGGRYMGGNPGCVEQGLLGNAGEVKANDKNAKGGKWDGRYTGPLSGTCVTTLPEKPSFSLNSAMDFPVINNTLNDMGNYASISENGSAIESFQLTEGNENGTGYLYSTAYYRFVMNGDKATFVVSGPMDVTWVRSDGTFFGSCKLTGSGVRN